MKIHVLHCGYIQVSESVPYGNSIDLKNTVKQLTAPDRNRITLPVCAYLIEHPKGLILVDTGPTRRFPGSFSLYPQRSPRQYCRNQR